MIDVGEGWVIDVAKHQYIAGKKKLYTDGKFGILDPHYVRTLSAAIADVCDRSARERFKGKEMSLKQAVLAVDNIYREFGAKVDELNRLLKERGGAQTGGTE